MSRKVSPGINRSSTVPGMYRANQRSILPDMKDIHVPEDVKVRANEIYNKLAISTKRGTRRVQMIFFCIYMAYRELGHPQDPHQLSSVLGLTKSEVNKTFSMFSEVQTGYRPDTKEVNVVDLLPTLCRLIGFEKSEIDSCVKVGIEIMEKESDLNESFPQKVAAGILQYYLTINGVQIDKKRYAQKIGLSQGMIQNMCSKVASVHNS